LQRNDRLEEQHEFVAIQGALQVVFQLEQSDGARQKFRCEHCIAPFAELFGPVHGDVGVAQHVFRRVKTRSRDGDPNARRCEEFPFHNAERGFELRENPLGEGDRVALRVNIFEQDREFVAAEARQRVAGPQTALETARDGDEQHVSRHVPETVVHELEAVEIQEQHGRDMIVAPLRASDHVVEAFHERRSVCEARELVVLHDVQQALFGKFAFGNLELQCLRAAP